MRKVWNVLTNKFFLTGVAFIAWMAYFDQNDFMLMQQRKKELQATKDNIAYLNTEIARMERENADIRTNPKKLEQFARENFRMKRDNEDLYVIDRSK
jgi:cell division protein FtsB